MNKTNKDIRIIFLKQESQSEWETSRAAHRIICNIIPHHKKRKNYLDIVF